MTNDYWECVQEYWPTIHQAYCDFEDKRPVIVVAIDELKVYSFSPEEYKKILSTRSQDILDKQYREAETQNKIVVFVRDDTNKKLVSYSCPWHRPVIRSDDLSKEDLPKRGKRSARVKSQEIK